eukprot:m.373518 g.373518  ORF g.373518 m.373518 type:complete len:157 (+) comp16690_c0_seq25:5442-5912(+)
MATGERTFAKRREAGFWFSMREQEREHFHGAEESGESADFAVVPEHITPPPPSASLPPFAMAGQAKFSAGGPRTTTGTAGKRTGRGSSPGAGGSKRRSRKEPLRHDFDNEAEYAEAYSQWREFRAKQAESVNRLGDPKHPHLTSPSTRATSRYTDR